MTFYPPNKADFRADILAHRVEEKIRDSWCLFREPSVGSRNGKIVQVPSRDIQYLDTGGQYTVKIYRSEKTVAEDSWSHSSIRLEQVANNPAFKPLLLEADCPTDLQLIGDFIAIAG